MSSNSFGTLFKITTWGESHGPALGVVIDGCPAGLALDLHQLQAEVDLRKTGNAFTSPRKEQDQVEVLSGIFEGKTTGAPISLMIRNHDADSSKYIALKEIYRPGHANYTYLKKYGIFDERGGGRSSGRETVCRVMAGAVAKQLIAFDGIVCTAWISQIGNIATEQRGEAKASQIFCPDPLKEQAMMEAIATARQEKTSLGGVISFEITGAQAGLGEPIYEKIEANLAKAMLSIPASKGFEIGMGFKASEMKGDQHNDVFGETGPLTNYAGGLLGGITTGQPIIGRVAFKPTSSIARAQESVDFQGNKVSFTLPEGSRHDPCVAIRAVPVVEAMCALVMADALLMHRGSRLCNK